MVEVKSKSIEHKLGALPPKRLYKDIRAKVVDFVDSEKVAAMPATPPYFHWAQGIQEPIPMFGNDRHGDCTCATEGQAEFVNSFRVGKPETPTLEAILEMYYATGIEQGLAPEDGRYEEGVLRYMARTGLRQADGSYEKSLGYAAVNMLDRTEILAAGYLFGGLRLTIALPDAAWYQWAYGITHNERPAWNMSKRLPDGTLNPGSWAPGSWGGHAVYVGSSMYRGLIPWSWQHRVEISYSWLAHYGMELYAVAGADWLRDLVIPGVDKDGLVNLLQELNG